VTPLLPGAWWVQQECPSVQALPGKKARMPTFKIARFEVRPEARLEVERAIREFALYVGLELEESSWVTYRERANPNRYVSLISAQDEAAEARQRSDQGTADFTRILHPRLVGEVDLSEYVLVASSRGGLPP